MGKISKKVVLSTIDESPEERKKRVNALNEFNRRKKLQQQSNMRMLLDRENADSRREIDEATFSSLYDYVKLLVLDNEQSDNPMPFDKLLRRIHDRLLPLRKRTDINRVRSQRKLLGDRGVQIFKNSIEESYQKVLTYLWRDLYNEVVLGINTDHEGKEDEKQEAVETEGVSTI